MKRISISEWLVPTATLVLTAFALFFANVACLGRFYEPEVPEQLK